MHKSIKEKIQIEINNIDKLIKEMAPILKKTRSNNDFNNTELYAAAAFLHSFYNGIEKILKLITREHFKEEISGKKWHKELLIFAKQNILTKETTMILEDYLGFRHFFRHTYTYQIKYKYLKELLKPLKNRWLKIKKEVNNFCNNN